VLVKYKERRFIIVSNCLSDLEVKTREKLNLRPETTVVFQRHDKEFEEFVDVEDFTSICNGDKLNLVHSVNEQDVVNTQVF